MKESSSPETKTGNKAIILIPEKGLCYHPDWPVEPSEKDFSGDQWKESRARQEYQQAITKAISEAVRFADQNAIAELIKGQIYSGYTRGGIVLEIIIDANHPYPIPEQYEVKVKKECVSCGTSEDSDCKGDGGGHCIFDSDSNHEGPVYQTLAYLLPLKESSTEAIDFKKLAFDMAVKVGESHDVVFVTRLIEALQSGSKKTVSRVEAGENKPDWDKVSESIYTPMAPGEELRGFTDGCEHVWNTYFLPLSSELNTLREEVKRLEKLAVDRWAEIETMKRERKLLDNSIIEEVQQAEEKNRVLKTELDEVKKERDELMGIVRNQALTTHQRFLEIESLLNPEKK